MGSESSLRLAHVRSVNCSGKFEMKAFVGVMDNDQFALVTLLMQDCFGNDRRHSCRTYINLSQRGRKFIFGEQPHPNCNYEIPITQKAKPLIRRITVHIMARGIANSNGQLNSIVKEQKLCLIAVQTYNKLKLPESTKCILKSAMVMLVIRLYDVHGGLFWKIGFKMILNFPLPCVY